MVRLRAALPVLLDAVGLGCLGAAGWTVTPTVGLVTAGLAAIVLGWRVGEAPSRATRRS